MKISVVLHDVSSNNRLMDFVKEVLAYKKHINMVVISRPTGGAAQYGVPEASKLLFKYDIKFAIIPDITDLHELFGEGFTTIQFTKNYGKEFKDLDDLKIDKNILLIFSGSETGFSKNELLENSIRVYPYGIERELSPNSYFSIFMHLISSKLSVKE